MSLNRPFSHICLLTFIGFVIASQETILDTGDAKNLGWSTIPCQYFAAYVNFANNCKNSAGSEEAKVGFWSGCGNVDEKCELSYQNGPIPFVKYTSLKLRYLIGLEGEIKITQISRGVKTTLVTLRDTRGIWRLWGYQFMTVPDPKLQLKFFMTGYAILDQVNLNRYDI